MEVTHQISREAAWLSERYMGLGMGRTGPHVSVLVSGVLSLWVTGCTFLTTAGSLFPHHSNKFL